MTIMISLTATEAKKYADVDKKRMAEFFLDLEIFGEQSVTDVLITEIHSHTKLMTGLGK